MNKKHDLVAIQITDPAELDFPNLGLLKVEDPETKETFWIDTSSKKMMTSLRKNIADKQFIFQKEMKKSGVDLIRISTDEDFVDPLMSFFRLREKRI